MRNSFPIFLVLAFLWSCGDDQNSPENTGTAGVQSEGVPVQKGPSAPVLAKPPAPTKKWTGNTFQYAQVFTDSFEIVEVARQVPPGAGPDYSVKRDASDPGTDPVEFFRLLKKADGLPYSGEISGRISSGEGLLVG